MNGKQRTLLVALSLLLLSGAAFGAVAETASNCGLERIGQLRERRSEQIGGSRWGVSCCWIADEHPLSMEQRLDHLSAIGAKWALLLPEWNRVEREEGEYDWNTPEHRLDDVINGLANRKIAPIIQIYGGNLLHMQTKPDANNRPQADAAKLLDDPEVRQAWHRFVEALVRRYRAHVKVWESWNEPNGEWFWATPTTVAQYGRMVKDVAAIIKRAQPQAVILAGSTANVPLDYLEKFLASDGAKSFHHWSVHPYGELPEAAEPRIQGARELLRKHGKSPAVWQSECGFPSSADTGGWGFGGPWDETKHAKWLLRRLLSDARLEMPVSIYFVLHDYRDLHTLTSAQRREWVAYLQSHLDHDGLYRDPRIFGEGWYKDDPEWCGRRRLTCHLLPALTCLGAVAAKPLRMLEPFYDKAKLTAWLEARDWSKGDYVGNEVLDLGKALPGSVAGRFNWHFQNAPGIQFWLPAKPKPQRTRP